MIVYEPYVKDDEREHEHMKNEFCQEFQKFFIFWFNFLRQVKWVVTSRVKYQWMKNYKPVDVNDNKYADEIMKVYFLKRISKRGLFSA